MPKKNWKCLTLDPYCFPGRPFVSFFCFAQGFEISSVLNLPQVVEQMN